MKRLYRFFLSIIILIFLSSYHPNNLSLGNKKNNYFLKVKNIKIINNFLIEKYEITEKLQTIYNMNIFLIKRKDIEDPLKAINFFQKIEVKKKYPNTIIIKIFETTPTAILYKNKDKYLLDSSSNLIKYEKDMDFGKLPNVFGKGAKNYFMNFLNQLKENNFPVENVKEFYFFQIGRWDLQLVNNKIIKFPNKNVNKAIIKSIKLLDREDFESYKIIDLRVGDKIIVE